MFDFSKILDSDEKILYQGRPVVGKGDKSIGGSIFIILFMLVIQVLMIWSLVTGTGDGADGITPTFIIIFAATLLFDGIAIYNIIYLKFLKDKTVSDDYYCITNKRALKFESKKDKLVYGYLVNYDIIEIVNQKDNVGDISMHVEIKDNSFEAKNPEYVKDILMNPNPENMPTMIFECVENPKQVKKIIKDAQKELE